MSHSQENLSSIWSVQSRIIVAFSSLILLLGLSIMFALHLLHSTSEKWLIIMMSFGVWSALARFLFLRKILGKITSSEHAASELRRSEERLRMIAEVASDGVWEFDVRTREGQWSDRAYAMLGYTRDTFQPRYESFRAIVHPDELDQFKREMREHLQTKAPYMATLRLRHRDGTYIPVLARGQVQGSDRMVGVFTDISLVDRAERQIRKQARILDQVGQSVIATDPAGNIEYANRFAQLLFGWELEEVLGRNIIEVTAPQNSEAQAAEIMRTLRQGASWSGEFAVQSRDGRVFPVSATDTPLHDGEGELVGIVGVSVDISERKQAELVMRESEREQREQATRLELEHSRLIEAQVVGKIGSWETDLSTFEVTWSAETFRIFGTSSDQFHPTQDGFLQLVHPDDRAAVQEAFVQSAGAEPNTIQHRIVMPDGSIKFVEERWRAFHDAEGRPFRAVGTTQDITESRVAEERLEQSLAMINVAGRIALMGAWAVDLPSLVVRWSDEVRRLHEVPVDFVPVIETAIEFYAPEHRAVIGEAVEACIREGTPFDLELQIITANGRRVWVRALGEAVRDAAGAITRVQGAFQDVSGRHEEQRELARTNRALQMLSKCNDAVVRAPNEQHLIEQVCQIAAGDGGYRMAWVGYACNDEAKTIEPVAYAGVEDGYLTDITATWMENDPRGLGPAGRAIRSGRVALSSDLAGDDAMLPWAEAAEKRGYRSVICLPLCEGIRAFGLLGLYSAGVLDIGDEEIRLLQTLAANLAFGILNIRSRIERERVERAVVKVAASVSATGGTEFYKQLALNMAEATGAQAGFVARLLPGDPVRARTITAVIDGETVEDFEYVLEGTPCESLVEREECIVPSQVADHFPRSPSLRALKAQAYVGRRLVDSEGRPVGLIFVLFRKPLDSPGFVSSTMQIFATRAGAELERQEAGERILEQASLLDKATDAIYVRDLNRHITYWNKSAERLYGWSSVEALGRSARELHHPDEESADQHFDRVLESGEWSGEFEEMTRDGRQVTVEARWTLVRDEDGRPKSILSIETDVTERKALEAQYLRAQRMESVGTLAGGMAHDLNNVLAPIMMGVSFLQGLEVRENALTVLKTIERSAKRGSDLVQQVLSFARGVEGARVPVALDPIVREVESIAESTFPKNITFERDIADDLWLPIGDPTQMTQVLLNLCVNARDAMTEGGRLRVAARNVSVDQQTAVMDSNVPPGRYVLLEVTDEGSGMSDDVLDRVFEPFFTTKEIGRGTGLGLSTVAAIVKSYGGIVTAGSEVGKGSVFKVYLNAATADRAPEPVPLSVTALHGQGQLLLVVDDEVAILNVLRLTMEASGYRIMVAENGVQAIALYAVHRDEIALVITDMMMPVMDGPALIAALYRINPEVKIIAASGLNTKGDIAKAGSAGVKHFLAKPYSAERILEVVGSFISEEPELLPPSVRLAV